MKRSYTITNMSELSLFFKETEERFVEHGPQIAEVRDDNRTIVQLLRGLYWHFAGQIAAHTGDDKQYLHDQFKRLYLIPIYSRDPAKHHRHENVLVNMHEIKRDKPEIFEKMAQLVIEGTHIEEAGEDEWREYIGLVEQHGIKMGVRFKLSRNEQEFWGERGK